MLLVFMSFKPLIHKLHQYTKPCLPDARPQLALCKLSHLGVKRYSKDSHFLFPIHYYFSFTYWLYHTNTYTRTLQSTQGFSRTYKHANICLVLMLGEWKINHQVTEGRPPSWHYLLSRAEFIAWYLRHLKNEDTDGIKHFFLWRLRMSLNLSAGPKQ